MNSLRLSKDLNPIRSDSIRFEIKCSGVDSAETAGVTRGGGEAGVDLKKKIMVIKLALQKWKTVKQLHSSLNLQRCS